MIETCNPFLSQSYFTTVPRLPSDYLPKCGYNVRVVEWEVPAAFRYVVVIQPRPRVRRPLEPSQS
jgi:hypothetical protein